MSETSSTVAGSAGTTIAGSASITGGASNTGPAESTISGFGSVGGASSVSGSVSIGGAGSVPGAAPTIAGAASVPSSVSTVKAPPVVPPVSATTKLPEEDEKAESDTAATLTGQALNDARHTSIIEELLQMYKTSLSDKVVSDAKFQEAARSLANVFTRILANPTTESLDVLWKFFVDNANTVLQETVALSGVEALAPAVRSRTELAYTLVRKAVRGIDVSDPKLVSQTPIKTIIRSPKFINYLSSRSKNVKKA